jgi:hypothetical protein
VSVIRRISLLVVVFVVGGGAALAQIHSMPTRTKPSIELKLSSATSMVCVGSSLPLDHELTNRGPNKFKVDKFDIGCCFIYGFLGDETGRGGATGIGDIDRKADFINIDSNKTYKSSFKFDLTNEFFKDPGKYVIQTTLEGVHSNKVEFELITCK